MNEELKKIVIPNEILLGRVSELLAEGKEVTINTKGNSMLPFIIGERDTVTLKKSDSPAVGDIVLAEIAPGRYVLHRIFAIDGDRVTLMGDGNLKGTETCKQGRIAGTVIAITSPEGKEKKLSRGRIWRAIRPVRRYLLFIFKRLKGIKNITRTEYENN